MQAITKALIGDVDHRRGTGFQQNLYHSVPLGGVQVRTGWIVTTTMQQHHIALFGGLEISDQPVKIHATRFIIKVPIGHGIHIEVVKD